MTVTNLLSALVYYNRLFENIQIRYDRVWPIEVLTCGVARKSPGGCVCVQIHICKFCQKSLSILSFCSKSLNAQLYLYIFSASQFGFGDSKCPFGYATGLGNCCDYRL